MKHPPIRRLVIPTSNLYVDARSMNLLYYIIHMRMQVSNGENGHEKGDESVYMWCRATS